jgi:hypothetical protein
MDGNLHNPLSLVFRSHLGELGVVRGEIRRRIEGAYLVIARTFRERAANQAGAFCPVLGRR